MRMEVRMRVSLNPNNKSFFRTFFLLPITILLTTMLINLSLSTKSLASLVSSRKLEIPRFVSIKSNEATLRSGASKNSSVLTIFIKKNEPIEVIAQSDNWRKIRDFEGEEGWIHSSLLSGRRYVVISVSKNKTNYNQENSKKDDIKGDVFKLLMETNLDKNPKNEKQSNKEPNKEPQPQQNITNATNATDFVELKSDKSSNSYTKAKLYNGLRCKLLKIDIKYCKIECNQVSGWVKKNFLWGVYKNETHLK